MCSCKRRLAAAAAAAATRRQQQNKSYGPAAADATIDVCLEATPLVLEDPAIVEAHAAAAAGAGWDHDPWPPCNGKQQQQYQCRNTAGLPLYDPTTTTHASNSSRSCKGGALGRRNQLGLVAGGDKEMVSKKVGREGKAVLERYECCCWRISSCSCKAQGPAAGEDINGNRQRPMWLWDWA